MIKFTEEQLKEVKEKGEKFYKSISDVYCPYLEEKISFNARGLEHLKFKQRDLKEYVSVVEQTQY